MHDIICPHCNKAFKIDETGYADILKQVRDADFAAQLHERLELAEQDKRNAVALAQERRDLVLHLIDLLRHLRRRGLREPGRRAALRATAAAFSQKYRAVR